MRMLLFKRLLTTVILSLVLFVFFYFAGLVGGAAVAGGRAGAQIKHTADPQEDFNRGAAAGRIAGENFVKEYGLVVIEGAAVLALLVSAGLSFSGAFPWCRKSGPPKLPPSF